MLGWALLGGTTVEDMMVERLALYCHERWCVCMCVGSNMYWSWGDTMQEICLGIW